MESEVFSIESGAEYSRDKQLNQSTTNLGGSMVAGSGGVGKLNDSMVSQVGTVGGDSLAGVPSEKLAGGSVGDQNPFSWAFPQESFTEHTKASRVYNKGWEDWRALPTNQKRFLGIPTLQKNKQALDVSFNQLLASWGRVKLSPSYSQKCAQVLRYLSHPDISDRDAIEKLGNDTNAAILRFRKSGEDQEATEQLVQFLDHFSFEPEFQDRPYLAGNRARYSQERVAVPPSAILGQSNPKMVPRDGFFAGGEDLLHQFATSIKETIANLYLNSSLKGDKGSQVLGSSGALLDLAGFHELATDFGRATFFIRSMGPEKELLVPEYRPKENDNKVLKEYQTEGLQKFHDYIGLFLQNIYDLQGGEKKDLAKLSLLLSQSLARVMNQTLFSVSEGALLKPLYEAIDMTPPQNYHVRGLNYIKLINEGSVLGIQPQSSITYELSIKNDSSSPAIILHAKNQHGRMVDSLDLGEERIGERCWLDLAQNLQFEFVPNMAFKVSEVTNDNLPWQVFCHSFEVSYQIDPSKKLEH